MNQNAFVLVEHVMDMQWSIIVYDEAMHLLEKASSHNENNIHFMLRYHVSCYINECNLLSWHKMIIHASTLKVFIGSFNGRKKVLGNLGIMTY